MRLGLAILFIMILAAFYQNAMALGGSNPPSIFGPDGPALFKPNSDAGRMEDKIAEALAALPSHPGGKNEEADSIEDGASDLARNNSTQLNGSINSSINQNSSIPDNATISGSDAGVDDGNINAAFGSANRFKGFYATSASRHEIGKGGIDSSMFLSGAFEMDKSIKFQDLGF
jgi:hypothetical protein